MPEGQRVAFNLVPALKHLLYTTSTKTEAAKAHVISFRACKMFFYTLLQENLATMHIPCGHNSMIEGSQTGATINSISRKKRGLSKMLQLPSAIYPHCGNLALFPVKFPHCPEGPWSVDAVGQQLTLGPWLARASTKTSSFTPHLQSMLCAY